MALTKPLPSLEYLQSCFSLDIETGVLTWKRREDVPAEWNTRFAGKPAGTLRPDGYTSVSINGRRMLCHRIGWKLATGTEPTGEVDHRVGVLAGGQLDNLRSATVSQNRANSIRKEREVPRGVQKRPHGFTARIRHHGHQKCLGSFPTPELAYQAYLRAAEELHGEFAYHRRVA